MDSSLINLKKLEFIGKDLKRPECVLVDKEGTLHIADWRGGITLIYKNGDSFLSLPKLYKLTNDLYNDEFLVQALPSPVEKNGLKKYLKDNNFKNLKDAIKYKSRRS